MYSKLGPFGSPALKFTLIPEACASTPRSIREPRHALPCTVMRLCLGSVPHSRRGQLIAAAAKTQQNDAMLKFVILFPIYLVALFVLELWAPVDRHVIVPWTDFLATICAGLMQLFDSQVLVHGNVVASSVTGFAIAIERGCNGIEAIIILLSAMLAYPARWMEKIVGILVGFVCVQGVNLIRIISLYYLGNWNRTWFDWFHLYIWQALIVVDALVVFLIWLSWTRRRETARTRVAANTAATSAT